MQIIYIYIQEIFPPILYLYMFNNKTYYNLYGMNNIKMVNTAL